jgi:hypothetical protein
MQSISIPINKEAKFSPFFLVWTFLVWPIYWPRPPLLLYVPRLCMYSSDPTMTRHLQSPDLNRPAPLRHVEATSRHLRII